MKLQHNETILTGAWIAKRGKDEIWGADLTMVNKLPPDIKDKVLKMPEYRQGSNKVRVTIPSLMRFVNQAFCTTFLS